MIIYTVKSGDSLEKIAAEFSLLPEKILSANGLGEDEKIPVGAALVIPVNAQAHIVSAGDSLYSIALKYGTSVDELLLLNPSLRPPYTIYPGNYIAVPEKKNKREISVLGYAYPTISDKTLEKSLDSLTYIAIFSYTIRADGSMNAINDDRIIKTAKEKNVAPLLTLTNSSDGDGFSTDTVLEFLNNGDAVDTFVNGIPDFLKQKGYLGINVDFEYVSKEGKEQYNEFLKKLSDRLSAEGLITSVALAPKYSKEQKGTLYEGHDYKTMGEYCDFIMLMTYEWGYTAGPPLSVSPYSEVKKVISYAVSEIPKEKILLGTPNYGYDWTLPYSPGTRAVTVGLSEDIKTAAKYNSAIRFNESASAPFFTYNDMGRDHIVWFDDARSIQKRLSLIDEFGLGGVGIWTINRYFAPYYEILKDYKIKKLL